MFAFIISELTVVECINNDFGGTKIKSISIESYTKCLISTFKMYNLLFIVVYISLMLINIYLAGQI